MFFKKKPTSRELVSCKGRDLFEINLFARLRCINIWLPVDGTV
jgi:hypothetical protein